MFLYSGVALGGNDDPVGDDDDVDVSVKKAEVMLKSRKESGSAVFRYFCDRKILSKTAFLIELTA